MARTASPQKRRDAAVPTVSVVMPVYNAMPHLDEAIESILGQTFADFEFIILDDGSTDGSGERIRHWAGRDSRIHLLSTVNNLGPVGSSNMVAGAARAELVARMDADDLSYPDRLRQQMEVFREHPNAGVVGSLCDLVDASGAILRHSDPWRISRRSPFVPFAHGAMMYRRSQFERVGGYREECAFWEDQDLVVRMAGLADVLVIPHALYRIRVWTSSTRRASDVEKLERAIDRMYAATDRLRNDGRYQLGVETGAPHTKVDPRVFVSLGSVSLWAGEKPRLFRRLLSRARMSFDFRTMSALVWTAWASVSPGSLRGFLRLLLLVRKTIAAAKIHSTEPVIWTPGLGATVESIDLDRTRPQASI
jgi:glycosyltransferase involved in cell wall biosynthesis